MVAQAVGCAVFPQQHRSTCIRPRGSSFQCVSLLTLPFCLLTCRDPSTTINIQNLLVNAWTTQATAATSSRAQPRSMPQSMALARRNGLVPTTPHERLSRWVRPSNEHLACQPHGQPHLDLQCIPPGRGRHSRPYCGGRPRAGILPRGEIHGIVGCPPHVLIETSQDARSDR